jgi:hypothetical protein
MIYQLANMLWHTDSSFKQVPSLCSLLSARIVPPEGGATEFASDAPSDADLVNYGLQDPQRQLVLTAATGATIAGGPGVVTIVNDDFPPGQTGLAAYWVQFAYEGSSGSFKGTEGCPVSRLGGAIMNGMVEGSERVPRDDDIEYHGKLWLFTDIELCEADRFNGSSEDKLCAIHALGSADVNAELSVYADSRGGWIKESADPRSVRVKMYGSCTSKLMADEARVYPDNSMANVFNASELKIPSGPLRPGQSYPAADDPHWVFTVIEKIR